MARAGNNHKGGRPKGSKSPLTLKIDRARQALIDAYIEKIKPINEALLAKALAGDIQAIKELHDRVYGRPAQPLIGDRDNPIMIQEVEISVRKK